MARSIHTTRRTLKELSRRKFPDAGKKQRALEEAAEMLVRKRRIKRMVKEERRREFPPLATTAVSVVPIEVQDESEVVYHGASPADVRAILNKIPEGARLGISRIRLSLGKAHIDGATDDPEGKRDPFTKRLGDEFLPGVFCGEILGSFSGQSGLISVYAFVYDRGRVAIPLPLCEFYLRLHALKTLVHEIAHHHDLMARTARGRWRSDRRTTAEMYAEKMEHEWTQNIVLPYLRRAYAEDASALQEWVAHKGGLRVGLDFFAGDTRRTMRNGLERLVLTTSSGFECWLGELCRCKTLEESRLAFAWELHYSDLYQECLKIVDGILFARPKWVPALTCKADTLVHLELIAEAWRAAHRALELEPSNSDAWETQGDVLEIQHKWDALLENCESWQQSGSLSERALRENLLHRAIAHCGLNNNSAMEECVTAYLRLFNFKTPEIAARRRKIVMNQVFQRADRTVPAQYAPKQN
jgi:hypothetical protein